MSERAEPCELCGGRGIIEVSHECADGQVVEWDEHCPECDELTSPTTPEETDD